MKKDMYLTVFVLVMHLILLGSLFISAHVKGWFGLHNKLKDQRRWYPKIHEELMNNPYSEKYQKYSKKPIHPREKLINLEKKSNESENRFSEVEKIFGAN